MPALIGAAVAVVAAAIAWYGAYGDPHHQVKSQTAAVPFLVIVDVVVAALIFGLLVPRALRSGSVPWGLVTSIVALVGVVAFWSGVPFVVGAAGALIGAQGKKRARDTGARAGGHTAALVIGVVAMALGLVMVVLGNTVLTSN